MKKYIPFFTIVILLGLLLSGISQSQAATAVRSSQATQMPSKSTKLGRLEGSAAKPFVPSGKIDYRNKPLPGAPNPPTAFTNYRAVTDTNTSCNANHTNCSQQEPYIAINPNNPNNIVASAKDWRPENGNRKQDWAYTTTDNGATWRNQGFTYPPGTNLINSSDPIVLFDANGIVYANQLVYNAAQTGNYVSKSTDGGITWQQAVRVDSGDDDKNWMTLDQNPTSPYFGRIYVCWWDIASSVLCSYSADQAATWSAPITAATVPDQPFLYPVVQPNGTFVVFYMDYNTGIEYLVRSSDGGQTFGNPLTVVTTSQVNQRSGRAWRVNTIPAAAAGPEGNLYLTWLDGRNEATTKWDTYFTRSTDNGATWSTPLKVNDDSGGFDQFEPAIAVAPNGRVDLAWMDMRNDPGNLLSDTYYSYSTNGGQTFTANQRVSDVNFNLNNGIPSDSSGSAGDYIGITSTNDNVWPAWTDTRNPDGRGSYAQDIYVGHLQFNNGTATPTLTGTPPTSTPTSTPIVPTSTPTFAVPTSTSTALATSTATLTPAVTDTPTATTTSVATSTPTDCPNPFVDLSGNIFYPAIHILYCRGVVNGTDGSHYTPAGSSTRAQFAKVVVLGFGIASYTPATPTFTDVPSSYFAYPYVESGYHAGILSGFDANTCAQIGATFPCYGPNRPITRAQLTKLVVNAAGYTLYTPTSPSFIDVLPNNIFYVSIETAFYHRVINGYSDRTFRPNNNIRRDEMAQIVYTATINP